MDVPSAILQNQRTPCCPPLTKMLLWSIWGCGNDAEGIDSILAPENTLICDPLLTSCKSNLLIGRRGGQLIGSAYKS